MRKKNYTAVTFILAGAMVVGGAGSLSSRMSSARTDDVETNVETTVQQTEGDASTTEETEDAGADTGVKAPLNGAVVVVTDEAENPEDNAADTEQKDTLDGKQENAADENSEAELEKISQEGKGFYLPKGAVLEKEVQKGDETEYTISWDGHQIVYYQGAGFQKEKESDLSIADAVVTAQKVIADFGKEDAAGADITIGLHKNGEDSEKEKVDNKKNYGVRYYELCVRGVKDHSYWMKINSITGEVFEYFDFYAVNSTKKERIKNKVIYDGYTEQFLGYGVPKNASDKEIHDFYDNEIKEAEKLYSPIAKDFIEEHLNLGKVTKCYGFTAGEMVSSGGGRDVILCYCRTDNSDVVEVQIDQITKTVQSIVVNPLFC